MSINTLKNLPINPRISIAGAFRILEHSEYSKNNDNQLPDNIIFKNKYEILKDRTIHDILSPSFKLVIRLLPEAEHRFILGEVEKITNFLNLSADKKNLLCECIRGMYYDRKTSRKNKISFIENFIKYLNLIKDGSNMVLSSKISENIIKIDIASFQRKFLLDNLTHPEYKFYPTTSKETIKEVEDKIHNSLVTIQTEYTPWDKIVENEMQESLNNKLV